VLATVLEPETGGGGHRPGDLGHEDLAGLGERRDPRDLVDRHAAHPVARHFDLADVDADPHLQAVRCDRRADRRRALQRPGGAVEHGENAVAGGVDLTAPEQLELAAHALVVQGERLPPGPLADGHRLRGGADEVGHEERRQHPVVESAAEPDPGAGAGYVQRHEGLVAGDQRVVTGRAVEEIIGAELHLGPVAEGEQDGALEDDADVARPTPFVVSQQRSHVGRVPPPGVVRRLAESESADLDQLLDDAGEQHALVGIAEALPLQVGHGAILRAGPRRRQRTASTLARRRDDTGNEAQVTGPIGPTDDQRQKRKGIAVESLVTALCVLGSGGELNVATSLVDDDGVDLVLFRMAGGATLSLQVKSRFATSQSAKDGKVEIVVKKPATKDTFRARKDFFLLFLIVDALTVSVDYAWLVPSITLWEELKDNSGLHFIASLDGTENRWTDYKIDPNQLAAKIQVHLKELETVET
jgi:hypothetical protein